MAYFGTKNTMLIGLKGEQGEPGAAIVSTVLQGQDENGGNIYLQTFANGTTATFTAPKGAEGSVGVSIVSASITEVI